MDDIVKQAMTKWPNVPDCFGWLGLDRSGNWYLRDDHAQSVGGFTGGLHDAKGSLLTHQKLIAYIQRNYSNDDVGQWYFQNGPQRVYVELAATPWIWRIDEQHQITSHCGHPVQLQKAHTDECGWLYLETTLGFGLVRSQDMMHAADAIEAGEWSLTGTVRQKDIEHLYGFCISPNNRQNDQRIG